MLTRMRFMGISETESKSNKNYGSNTCGYSKIAFDWFIVAAILNDIMVW